MFDALAADAAAEESGFIQEIVVTAQKRATLLRETPISLTYIGDELLARNSVDSVLDIEHLVPGLKIGQLNNAARISIRGIGNENLVLGGDTGVAFHVDNVFIARPEAAMAAFFDVERIEVLRGPQGTLYGRNATGGTINVINKGPTEEFEGQIYGEAGNFNRFGGGAVLSGPIAGEKLMGRLSFRMVDSDGYVKNVVPDRPDLNSTEFYSLRGQLLFEPNENLSIHVRADYHEDDDTGPTSVPLGTLTGPPFAVLFFGATIPEGDFVSASDADPFHKTEIAGASVTVDWDLGDAALTSITAYRDNDVDTFFDADGTAVDYQTVTFHDWSDQFSQELRLASTNSESFEWLIGAYYFDEDASQDLTTDIAGVVVSADPLILVPVSINLGGNVKTESYAAFGNAKWKIADQFHLSGGLRYTHDEKKMTEYNDFGGLFGPVPLTGSGQDSWEEVTYSVGLQYFPVEKTMLFATLSTGFKSGGFNAGGLTPSYDPEKALNIEVGIKSRFLGDRAELNATYFHTNYDDLQVAQVIGLAVVVNNAAQATLQGIEVEGVFFLTEEFSVSGSFSYLDATFDEYFNVDVADVAAGLQDLSGRHLPNTPKHSFTIAPEYRVDVADYGTLTLYGSYYWEDRVFFEPFNNLPYSQPSVGQFDLGASFASADERWKLTVYGKNLGDKRVFDMVSVGSAAIGGDGRANLAKPRTYGARLEFNF